MPRKTKTTPEVSAEERSLLDPINENPLDDGRRKVYADWLDEHDRPEEADEQRRWVTEKGEAYTFLREFTRSARDGYDYDQDGERIPGTLKYDHTKVMAEIEYWAAAAKNDFSGYYGNELCFSTTHAQDALSDEETKRKFWDAVHTLTGVNAPADLRGQEWYRCAC